MAYVAQRHRTDCGIAALAMLCNVTYEEADRAIPWGRHGVLYGTDTKLLKAGAERLGYEGLGTEKGRLHPQTSALGWWTDLPENTLVKVPHPDPKISQWHWVVWRKGKIYCPTRGVFKPDKYGRRPAGYMQFVEQAHE